MSTSKLDNLFRALPDADGELLEISFNHRTLSVPAGISVAAALLLGGVRQFRTTPTRGSPRAPYCMMGACFDCLVEIDGVPNKQSCLITVRAGMQVRLQNGASELMADAAGDAATTAQPDSRDGLPPTQVRHDA